MLYLAVAARRQDCVPDYVDYWFLEVGEDLVKIMLVICGRLS